MLIINKDLEHQVQTRMDKVIKIVNQKLDQGHEIILNARHELNDKIVATENSLKTFF